MRESSAGQPTVPALTRALFRGAQQQAALTPNPQGRPYYTLPPATLSQLGRAYRGLDRAAQDRLSEEFRTLAKGDASWAPLWRKVTALGRIEKFQEDAAHGRAQRLRERVDAAPDSFDRVLWEVGPNSRRRLADVRLRFQGSHKQVRLRDVEVTQVRQRKLNRAIVTVGALHRAYFDGEGVTGTLVYDSGAARPFGIGGAQSLLRPEGAVRWTSYAGDDIFSVLRLVSETAPPQQNTR